MKKISKRNQRALIAIVAAVLLYAGLDLVAFPFFDRQRLIDDEIASSERQLRVALRGISQEPFYQERLGQVSSVVEQHRGRLLDAADPASAGVQLEGIVRNLAAESGVRVSRSNPVPDKKVGENYAKISLQMNLESDIASLIKFLHAVSSYDKFLLVEDFNVASFRVRDETRIQPRLQISAFIRLS